MPALVPFGEPYPHLPPMPSFTRRHALIASLTAGLQSHSTSALAAKTAPFKAVAFDGFPIFDLRPVAAAAEVAAPGRGAELVSTWRTRQFEYQWLRALSNDYADFWQTTKDSLEFALRARRLDLDAAVRERLLNTFTQITVWPDVADAVQRLRETGLRVAIVSNMTQRLLDDGLQRAGLSKAFDHVLSTDAIRSYKPHPGAYQLSVDALGLHRQEILFAPFAGWDAAGAKAFGHPTFWVNRFSAPSEELGTPPDGVGRDMADLLRFLQLTAA